MVLRNRARTNRARTGRSLLFAIAVVSLAGGCTAHPGPGGTQSPGSAGSTAATASPSATAGRQAEVAERGRSVMPFDLGRTTHVFTKTAAGGVQTVVADRAGDADQVALIRRHLRAEAERFRAGDFTDPAAIHGDEMPGLAALRGSQGRVHIEYADMPDGARITYTAADLSLVAALHAWFDAQIGDHGDHARHG